ncbi:MAG TPA: cysteine dioxygenase family protein, partial [Ilumatobacteraceae bacterium]
MSILVVADPWKSAAARATHPALPSDHADGLLTAIATGLASVALPWELAAGEQHAERQFQLLIATDVYDAWLVHWPVGTGLDLHDHGGSAGAFAVVAGDLDEDVVRDGTTVTTRVGPGDSVVFGEGHVHAVVNRGDVGATSVHVYSPPL